jgi:hypothetical protein
VGVEIVEAGEVTARKEIEGVEDPVDVEEQVGTHVGHGGHLLMMDPVPDNAWQEYRQ